MKLRTAIVLATALLAIPARTSAAEPDHRAWSELLRTHVEGGRVDYDGLAAERAALDAYLQDLAATPAATFPTWSRKDRLAFWINAYNAWTVALVLDHLPLESIREIVPMWRRALGESVFERRFIPLAHLDPRGSDARTLSLDDIEHGILRPLFADPRVHFALNCASRSCPELRAEAWTGAGLAEALEAAGRRFLGDRSKNRYLAEEHRLELSSIFKWFAEDFARPGTVDFVSAYLPEADGRKIRSREEPPEVVYLSYDWSLNRQ